MILDRWKALSSRIQGLLRAAELSKFDTSYHTLSTVGEHGIRILGDLKIFRNEFENALPPAAKTAIDECVSKNGRRNSETLLHDTTTSGDIRNQQIWAGLVLLAATETELTYILSDSQAAIRFRLERAFLHLQRMIVVDNAVRQQWIKALETGETACERLGAVHLLWHGIWAFKVIGEGERTDLVYENKHTNPDAGKEQEFVDGLVLTEWKKANTATEVDGQFIKGREQANRYGEGVLAGNYLTNYRYIIVLSERNATPPDDCVIQNVTYRHINIAVDPESPSKSNTRVKPRK